MLKLNRKGFILIELILVLFILISLLSMFKININILSRTKKNIEINRLIDDLETYRDKALINKINIEFRIESGNKSYIFTERGGDRTRYLRRELTSGYSIYHNTISPFIVFKSTGSPSTGVTLIIKDSSELNNIIIQPVTGKIRLEKMIR